MGLLTKKDSTLYRSFFKEMAYLRGIKVKYQYLVKAKDTVHGEILVNKLSRPIDIDIIFEENPKVSTLRSIGWISENPDDKPYVAMLPFDIPHLTVKCVISIPPFREIDTKYRRFEVTSINTILEFPDCWVCTLAPVFDSDKPKDSYDATNYNYIDTPENPNHDSPNNYMIGCD